MKASGKEPTERWIIIGPYGRAKDNRWSRILEKGWAPKVEGEPSRAGA